VATAVADQGWQGVSVMPKSDQLQIRSQPGGYSKGDLFQIAWPAVVEKTDGRWLKIRDEGGYAANGLAGWVYADEVLKSDNAQTYYADRIAEAPARWLYWLDGICWETNNESANALEDFAAAEDTNLPNLKDPLDPRLDDVLIRTGRLRAANHFSRLAASDTVEDDADKNWEQFLTSAKLMKPNRPILYLVWGNAKRQAYQCAPRQLNGKANDNSNDGPSGFTTSEGKDAPAETVERPTPTENVALEALEYYNQAESLSRGWWAVPLARAEVLLERCTKLKENQFVPGAMQFDTDIKPDALQALLGHCPKPASPAGGPSNSGANSVLQTAQSGAPGDTVAGPDLKALRARVLVTALKNFDRAIYLKPNSPDAHRDRAEVLLLASQIEPARQSALTACMLSDFQVPASLRILAQICGEQKDFGSAQSFAQQAAQNEPDPVNRQKLVVYYNTCGALAKRAATTALTAASETEPDFSTVGFTTLAADIAKKDPMAIQNSTPPPGFVPQPFAGLGK
jgi:predicted secreted protein